MIVKIIDHINFLRDSKIVLKVKTFIFNPKTPFYFNYWLAYTFLAIIILTIFSFFKNYSYFEIIIGIGVNLILFVIILTFIINNM